MSGMELPTDINSQFTSLSQQFEDLGRQVEAIDVSPRKPDVEHPWKRPEQTLVRRAAELRLISRYRHLVKTAGELLLALDENWVAAIDCLPEFIAAHELGEWGGLSSYPGNLFGLLVKGERVELRDEQGNFAEYEITEAARGTVAAGEKDAAKPGIRFEIRPAKRVRGMIIGAPWESKLPDHDQCLRYAKFLRSLNTPNRVGCQLGKKPGEPVETSGRRKKYPPNFAEGCVMAFFLNDPDSDPTSAEIAAVSGVDERVIRNTKVWKKYQAAKTKGTRSRRDVVDVGETDKVLEELAGQQNRGRDKGSTRSRH